MTTPEDNARINFRDQVRNRTRIMKHIQGPRFTRGEEMMCWCSPIGHIEQDGKLVEITPRHRTHPDV